MHTPQGTTTHSTHNGGPSASAMHIEPYFCPSDVDPFDTVEWEPRTAHIKDENGGILFEQNDCMVPKSWSPLATNVVVSKYFYGEPNTPERETSVKQVVHRVARTIADWGIADGYFATPDDGEAFYRELAWLLLHQHGAFNSPVWFNVGLFQAYGVKGSQGNYRYNPKIRRIERPETPYEFPQASACFIQSVDDNMEDIMRLATSAKRCSSSSAPEPAPTSPPSAAARENSPAAAPPPGRCPSCGSTTRSPPSSSPAEKPAGPPRCSPQGLASRRHGLHSVQSQRGEEGPHPHRKRQVRRQLQRRRTRPLCSRTRTSPSASVTTS
jgi:hypothetical protein